MIHMLYGIKPKTCCASILAKFSFDKARTCYDTHIEDPGAPREKILPHFLVSMVNLLILSAPQDNR